MCLIPQDEKVRKEAINCISTIYRHITRDEIRTLPFYAGLRDAQRAELEKSIKAIDDVV